MIQQTVNIPDKDYQLFLEVAKKFKWKVQEPSRQIVDDFVITDEMLDILDKRSETPNNLCISEEESIRRLNAL